jgi:hypothetical protein
MPHLDRDAVSSLSRQRLKISLGGGKGGKARQRRTPDTAQGELRAAMASGSLL